MNEFSLDKSISSSAFTKYGVPTKVIELNPSLVVPFWAEFPSISGRSLNLNKSENVLTISLVFTPRPGGEVGVVVGVEVGFLVGVGVVVGVLVGAEVFVGVGVKVGPNICPGAHAEARKLKRNSTINVFFTTFAPLFVLFPLLCKGQAN
jgi:hypothetical protein